MGADGNPGINKLGRVLQGRMKACGAAPLLLDFGTIQGDLSLLTNTYPIPIPKTDYTVCRQLTLGTAWSVLTRTQDAGNPMDGNHTHSDSGTHEGHAEGDGSHSHTNEAAHIHDVLIPEKMRKLKSGDRVLVAWVQNEAVVVDIILPATEL